MKSMVKNHLETAQIASDLVSTQFVYKSILFFVSIHIEMVLTVLILFFSSYKKSYGTQNHHVDSAPALVYCLHGKSPKTCCNEQVVQMPDSSKYFKKQQNGKSRRDNWLSRDPEQKVTKTKKKSKNRGQSFQGPEQKYFPL